MAITTSKSCSATRHSVSERTSASAAIECREREGQSGQRHFRNHVDRHVRADERLVRLVPRFPAPDQRHPERRPSHPEWRFSRLGADRLPGRPSGAFDSDSRRSSLPWRDRRPHARRPWRRAGRRSPPAGRCLRPRGPARVPRGRPWLRRRGLTPRPAADGQEPNTCPMDRGGIARPSCCSTASAADTVMRSP
jgi:hypothetical protein